MKGIYTNNQYYRSTTGEKKYIHRMVMENHLGRKLLRNEQVHHKNGNKLDNRINNLEVMSNQEHQRLHVIEKTIQLQCFRCKNIFYAMDKPFYKIRYCSSKCRKWGARRGYSSKHCWNR